MCWTLKRRMVSLSGSTACGSRDAGLETRAAAAREAVLDLARSLIGDRDIAPAVELLRDLMQYSEFEDLISRRRELIDGSS